MLGLFRCSDFLLGGAVKEESEQLGLEVEVGPAVVAAAEEFPVSGRHEG